MIGIVKCCLFNKWQAIYEQQNVVEGDEANPSKGKQNSKNEKVVEWADHKVIAP